MKSINILLIEDELPDADFVREMLEDANGDDFTIEHISTLSGGLDRLAAGGIDVILLDLSLPDSEGLETLTNIQAQAPQIPIIVLSGADAEAMAIQSVQEGAQDYLTKDQVNSNLLTRAIHYAIKRKQAEKKLRESKEKYQALYNSIRDAILVINMEREIIDCNSAFTDLFGYPLDEIKGREISFVYENEEEFRKLERSLKSTDTPNSLLTMNYQKKSGQVFPGETNFFYLRDQGGNAQGFIGLIRDITEQKRAKQQAIQQKEFLENILESLTHPFYVVNIDDYTIEVANSAAIPAEESSENMTCYSITHNTQAPCSGEEHPCPIEEIQASHCPVTMEHIHYEADGLPHHVEIHGYPIFDGEGNVSQMIEYTLDITERKQAERALRRERDLVARLMDTSPVSITMVNQEGKIVFANARAEEVLGLSKDELLQRTYHAPEWRITDFEGNPFPEEKLPFQQVMRTGKPIYDVRHAIEWPNGERKLLSINGAPLLDEKDQVERVIFAIQDVTKQVQAERKRIEKFKREIQAIEQIAALPNTTVSARSFGAARLKEILPDVFDDLVKSYKELMDKALERKVYKMENTMSNDIRNLANRLGALKTKPRDVIDIHITALREQSDRSNALKSETYAEEGRLIALELMGHLVSYYRNRCDTSPHFPSGVEKREEL